MVSTLLIHSSMQRAEQSRNERKHIYTPHDSSYNLPRSEQPPTSLFKELMDAPTNFSDSRLMRLLANNAQRLQTEVKGLWNSAPRSAHPVGAYERSVNYPRLFQLDSSYGLGAKELPGGQVLKPAPDFQMGPKSLTRCRRRHSRTTRVAAPYPMLLNQLARWVHMLLLSRNGSDGELT
jgi:hypothetical protein